MQFHERLKYLRVCNDMTQKELSERLDISTVSIRNWETGTKSPSMSAIVSLAKIFRVSTDFLLGVTVDLEKDGALLDGNERTLVCDYRMLDKHGQKAVSAICAIEKARVKESATFSRSSHRYIPKYITPAAAGLSAPLDESECEMILVDESVPYNADFAVRIHGDSMYPYIQNGDIVYVKKDCELSVGDIGIFCVDGSMYCKQYYIDSSNNLVLISANPDLRNTNVYINSENQSSVVCYGKVLLDQKVNLPNYV